MVIEWWRQAYIRADVPKSTTAGQPIILSYLQLIETAVAVTLRSNGLSFSEIATAHDRLQVQFRLRNPYSSARMREARSHLRREFSFTAEQPPANRSEKTQAGWQAALAKRLEQFEYDDTVVRRWYPRGRTGVLVIDPQIAFGAPLIAGTAIPLHIIEERFAAGETEAEIAEDFGIETRQVTAALSMRQQKQRRVA